MRPAIIAAVLTAACLAQEPSVSVTLALPDAVATMEGEIRVSSSGKLTAPLVLRPGQQLICDEGVTITCEYSEMLPCITGADNASVTGCVIVGRWTGTGTPSITYKSMHGIACYGCENFRVDDVRIEGFVAGDGFYAGPRTEQDRTPCRAKVSDSTIIGNGRQGVSVVSGDVVLAGLLIVGNGVTAQPRAGIDFEPSSPKDTVRAVVTDCKSQDNVGAPYFVNLERVSFTSSPPSIVFHDCTATTSGSATLRLANVFESNGHPSVRMPKGTLIQWDGRIDVRVPQ